MDESTAVIFTIVTIICYLIFLVMAVIQRRELTKALRVFCLYIAFFILIALITQGFIWGLGFVAVYNFMLPILTKFSINDNSFLFVLYYLNNTLLLGYFYSVLLKDDVDNIKIYKIVFVVFLIELFVYFFVDGYSKIGKVNPIIDTVFCFTFPATFLTFWYKKKSSIAVPLAKSSYFLISLGLFVENILAFIYFIVAEKLYETDIGLYNAATSIKSCMQIFVVLLFIWSIYHAKYIKYSTKRFQP